jgi:hypothetical protein
VARPRRGFTLWHVVATLPWIVAVLVARSSIGDNSFLWHVTAGRLQVETGSVLTADPFSIVMSGTAWRTQSWMADVAYAWLDDLVGLGYVPWLRLFAALVLFGIVGLTAWSITRSIAASASVSFLVALLAVPYINPRPVIFSYVLLALVVLVEQSPRLRWSLPALFFVWASVHGSWVIGAGYLALSVLERREYRRIYREAPWIALVTMVTAHGWGVLDYLTAFARSGDALALISEWAPPDLISVSRSPFTVAVILLMLGGARGALTMRQVLFAVPVVLFGLSSSRSLLPAFLMLVPILASATAAILSSVPQRPLAGVKWVVAGVVVLPLVLPVTGGLNTNRFPVELIELVGERRIFHDDVIGGYLIYASWPETPVLVDDRAELFGSELARFVSVRSGREGWREYFEEYELEAAILGTDQALGQLLKSDGWVEVARSGDDDQWVLLESP